MVHHYTQDNGHELTIIQANSMFNEIYDYVMMGIGSNVCFCDWCTMLEWGS